MAAAAAEAQVGLSGCCSLPEQQDVFFCNSKGLHSKSDVFPLIRCSQQRPHPPSLIAAARSTEEGNSVRSNPLTEQFYQQLPSCSALPKPSRGRCSQFTVNHHRSVKQLLLHWAIWMGNLPPGQMYFNKPVLKTHSRFSL